MNDIPSSSDAKSPAVGSTALPSDPLSAAAVVPHPSKPSGSKTSGSKTTFGSSLMFNVVIPIAILIGAGLTVVMFGTVQPAQRPSLDTTRVGRLKALPPVRVERLRSLDETGVPLRLQVDGTVVPFREAKVAAEVAGRVVFKSDRCEAGSYVRTGEVLMRIDPVDYELEVDRLTRMQEQDYQSLRELDQEMANTKRMIDVAKQDVDLQRKEVERQKAMPAGFASRAEVDQANRALLAATQQLVGYENQLDLLKQRRIRLEATERLAATQLKVAEVNLARTEIRAPIDGVIVAEEADLNTFVARGATLVVIDDTSKVDVASSLRMDQLYWVLNQRETSVDPASRSYDLPETPAVIEYVMSGRDNVVYRWNGKLLSYDGIGLDPVTRTVPVRVVVDDPTQMFDAEGNPVARSGAPALVRGMYVRVKLMIQPKSSLVVIPARALQPGNRIFQFLPDESVLLESNADGKPSATPVVATGKKPNPSDDPRAADADESSDPSASSDVVIEDGFDPTQWMPGKVMVRGSVVPVDSLAVDLPDGAASDQATTSLFEGANRMWVCEVQDRELGGAFVVVSPLGGIDEGSLPVRADRSGLEGLPKTDLPQPSSPTQPSATQNDSEGA
ncbi:Multidrug resistance protein MdtA precursor [Rubripirellula lacrimiformis]|uniref:Multidrug resistance protein MdtA n=1 Tax=Rubripirellula lacrimiformis TaxID=1930273 RepID=A0A517NGU3_9BACT|nr:HlyD family efflux transporter periplasmic adaptor subunit [Rubripirellula lacrimiformis]QDT06352.1 Multidrug resistance protein MdtA precursor [Rubripirellula lacrimiformis]